LLSIEVQLKAIQSLFLLVLMYRTVREFQNPVNMKEFRFVMHICEISASCRSSRTYLSIRLKTYIPSETHLTLYRVTPETVGTNVIWR